MIARRQLVQEDKVEELKTEKARLAHDTVHLRGKTDKLCEEAEHKGALPLLSETRGKRARIIRMLMANGVDVSAQDQKRLRIIRMLMANGVDVGARDHSSNTALQVNAMHRTWCTS
nr:hypothetical protein BaRGS_021672 [Batillaria attramentaria]